MTIKNQRAPELRVPRWINEKGQDRKPLKLADLGTGYKLIYCFQSWCPGCHSHGFPTLKKIINTLQDKDFGFAVIQTVFEGESENGFEKLRETQKRYNLKIPFGHDPKDGHYPSFMEDYQTRGTPWFCVIDPDGKLVYSDFSLDADAFINAFSQFQLAG